jgi:hypothetical protein
MPTPVSNSQIEPSAKGMSPTETIFQRRIIAKSFGCSCLDGYKLRSLRKNKICLDD